MAGPRSAQFNQDLGNQFFQLIDSLVANTLNQANRIGGTQEVPLYDPNMTLPDPFRNAGYGEVPAQALGALSGIALDPTGAVGDIARVGAIGFPAMLELAQQLQRSGRIGDVAEMVAPVGRAGEAQGMRLFRIENPQGVGPFTNDIAPSTGQYWATDPGYAATARHMYPEGQGTPRVVEADLPLSPDRVLDISDDATFRRAMQQEGSPQARFRDVARRLMEPTQDMPVTKQRRLQSTFNDWESGNLDTASFVRELREEAGMENVSQVMADEGFDAMIQHLEDGLARSPTDREVVVFNRRAMRPRNIDDPEQLHQVLQMIERLGGGGR